MLHQSFFVACIVHCTAKPLFSFINIQNYIMVLEFGVFYLLLKYSSQMAQVFIGVCSEIYKMHFSNKLTEKKPNT